MLFLIVFSAVSFLYYGMIHFGEKMTLEFERFGVSAWKRKLTGILQLLGSIGLISGFFIPTIGFIVATGLAVLMLLAFIIRLRIRDGLIKSLPSFFYTLLNCFLSGSFYLEITH